MGKSRRLWHVGQRNVLPVDPSACMKWSGNGDVAHPVEMYARDARGMGRDCLPQYWQTARSVPLDVAILLRGVVIMLLLSW